MRDIFRIQINGLDTKQWIFKEEVVALSIEFSESSTVSHVIQRAYAFLPGLKNPGLSPVARSWQRARAKLSWCTPV
jgi:hypothetical protein